MGKYSLCWEGKVLDYKFVPTTQDFIYNFYCGDLFMGQIFRMGRKGRRYWSMVPFHPEFPEYRSLSYDGFATRLDAAEMCLQVNGYRRKE